MQHFPKKTALPGIFALILSLALTGCLLDSGYGPYKTIGDPTWVQKDSVLAFTISTGNWSKSNGIENDRVRIYTARLGATGFTDIQLRFETVNLVYCGNLQYRPQDSLLFFSYIPRSILGTKEETSCQDGHDTDRVLVAGKWGRDPFTPAPVALDTATLVVAPDSGSRPSPSDMYQDSERYTLCVKGFCLNADL